MKLRKIALTLSLMLWLMACNPAPTPTAIRPPTATQITLATSTPIPPPPTPAPLESVVEEAIPTVQAIPDNMVLIPAGSFLMGRDGSKAKNGPAYTLELPAFLIDRFEVTNDNFAQFVTATGYQTYAETHSGSRQWRDAAMADKGNHPIVYVTWNDAAAYCAWAGKRLPSEAEWEKAARGSDQRIYPWGNEFQADFSNVKERGLRGTSAVGSFPAGASPYQVEDMVGNVREWVADYLQPYPNQAAQADPYFGETFRVHRGGGWFDDVASEVATTYNRNAGPPDTSANDDIGFRCARNVP